ncbi:hypothetical protein C8R43DRAFT_1183703 [Mycena crocata]|nr:hypothetical protein C8R43DRAFT_1183703 [Mycena crocata]
MIARQFEGVGELHRVCGQRVKALPSLLCNSAIEQDRTYKTKLNSARHKCHRTGPSGISNARIDAWVCGTDWRRAGRGRVDVEHQTCLTTKAGWKCPTEQFAASSPKISVGGKARDRTAARMTPSNQNKRQITRARGRPETWVPDLVSPGGPPQPPRDSQGPTQASKWIYRDLEIIRAEGQKISATRGHVESRERASLLLSQISSCRKRIPGFNVELLLRASSQSFAEQIRTENQGNTNIGSDGSKWVPEGEGNSRLPGQSILTLDLATTDTAIRDVDIAHGRNEKVATHECGVPETKQNLAEHGSTFKVFKLRRSCRASSVLTTTLTLPRLHRVVTKFPVHKDRSSEHLSSIGTLLRPQAPLTIPAGSQSLAVVHPYLPLYPRSVEHTPPKGNSGSKFKKKLVEAEASPRTD